jgi:hypothetical protein
MEAQQKKETNINTQMAAREKQEEEEAAER